MVLLLLHRVFFEELLGLVEALLVFGFLADFGDLFVVEVGSFVSEAVADVSEDICYFLVG